MNKNKENKTQNEFIDRKNSSLVPKSYVDFKNKWVASQKNKEPKVKGWLQEKNLDRRELVKLKKDQHKHAKLYGRQFNTKMRSIKSKIRRINRKTHKPDTKKTNKK